MQQQQNLGLELLLALAYACIAVWFGLGNVRSNIFRVRIVSCSATTQFIQTTSSSPPSPYARWRGEEMPLLLLLLCSSHPVQDQEEALDFTDDDQVNKHVTSDSG
uniref:Uncharacterized protein n=1 Tax=Arundo donax TaxID=35708 RepID=A0A0A9HLS6_ARUDO